MPELLLLLYDVRGYRGMRLHIAENLLDSSELRAVLLVPGRRSPAPAPLRSVIFFGRLAQPTVGRGLSLGTDGCRGSRVEPVAGLQVTRALTLFGIEPLSFFARDVSLPAHEVEGKVVEYCSVVAVGLSRDFGLQSFLMGCS